MSFDSRGQGGAMSQINVTPLVDVMLVLLVIFMVTAPILQQGVTVELPQAKAGPLSGEEAQLVVSITKAGQVYLNEDPMSAGELASRLGSIAAKKPESQVFLRADAAVPYGQVAGVMASIKGAGIRRVGMVTLLPPGEK